MIGFTEAYFIVPIIPSNRNCFSSEMNEWNAYPR